MERAGEPSPGGLPGAEFPAEPVGSQVSDLEQSQRPAGTRQPGSPQGSPTLDRTAKDAAGAGLDPPGEKRLSPPRPGLQRGPPLSLGYGAFRRLGSAGPEPPSPGPASAEQPREGEAAGAELLPWAAPGEPAPGAWAPVELQVDVRVKPVGSAGGSRAPSPAPSTRFLTVPVPESPAFPRHAGPAHPLLQRTPSPGSTWGRGSPLTTARTESGRDAEGGASPAEGSAGYPTCRCRCKELGLENEDSVLLHPGNKKLPQAIALLGLPTYMKSLRWALAVMAVLLAVAAVTIVALASRAGVRCHPCPPGWVWSEEHCYYLSVEVQPWEASQAFCSAHSATLPLLNHTQDFLSRYPVTKYSWVGAQRGPQGWHWIDGSPLPPQLLPDDDEDTPGLSCACLEKGKLVARDCSSPRPWVCAKGTK
ncbi:killer cell lectin-like receptor subfamily G member 2 [Nycticebus coucang]|uniref:killer cell lectin-like receptor subfamily G member 2 n=1 Tax=Nycticebus coucang TaxID=9470 RepID=UPI00234CB563|nr:killer cell lectin-like receptor subfamily G member 2 [Nycticebus coucang]